jgi:hypothetical protein
VDNRWDADLMQVVGPPSAVHSALGYPQPVCGASCRSAGMPSTFRFAGVADASTDRVCQSSGLSMPASDCWRLPTLPSRLPSATPHRTYADAAAHRPRVAEI